MPPRLTTSDVSSPMTKSSPFSKCAGVSPAPHGRSQAREAQRLPASSGVQRVEGRGRHSLVGACSLQQDEELVLPSQNGLCAKHKPTDIYQGHLSAAQEDSRG